MIRARFEHMAWAFGLAIALSGPVAHAQEGEAPLEAPEELPVDPPVEQKLFAQLGAGLGVGLREIRLPTDAGERRIQSGIFPALDVDLRAAQLVSPVFLFGVRLRYQTSLGLVGRETPFAGVERETSMRLHHVEAGLEPALRLVRSRQSVVLGAFVGWSIRALRTESRLSIPDYSLHGPALRLELRVPLAGEAVMLRLAPELIVWLNASGALSDAGTLEPIGMAYGGEASLQAELAHGLALALAYRGSYGEIASALGGAFTDVEHFVTLQLALIY